MTKYLFLILVVFGSCQSSKKRGDSGITTFKKFPVEESINLKSFIQYPDGIISRMLLQDSSLIVYNWKGKGGYFFSEYSLNTKQNIGKYMPHGRSKGKALGALSAGIFKSHLWMYDIVLDKIILAKLKTKPTDTIVYEEYAFPHKYYNIQFVDFSKLIANGNYKTQNKLQEVDLITGKVTADFGIIDNVPSATPFYAWKRANEGLLSLSTDGEKLAIAHLWSDKIEIFDLTTKTGKTIQGPENFEPAFDTFKSRSNEDIIGKNENSRNAFSCLFTTKKYIYALYSGNNMDSPYINYGEAIYVYDWGGKTIKKINLDRYISSFVISTDNKTIYAYDVASQQIVKGEI